MTYRFLHAADLHLDSPFKGLGRTHPALAETLRDASLVALDRLVDAAIRERCHFVLFAGDVYDGLRRGVRAQLRLQRAAERLSQAGIPLVLLHGNHDPLDEGYTAVRAWPDGTHALPSERPGVVVFDTPGGRVTITGQSYPSGKVPQDLSAAYPLPEGSGLHIAMLHTQVTDEGTTNPYSPVSLEDLLQRSFHYWALGHVHRQQVLHASTPVVAYPGNLQGRHFGETGPRGALIVEGSPTDLRTRPLHLAPVVFETVSIDVAGLDLPGITAALTEALPDSTGELLLRAELVGRSDIFDQLQDSTVWESLLRDLDEATPAGATWLQIRSHVRPALDLEHLGEGHSLADALFRRADAWDEATGVLQAVPGLRTFASTLDEQTLAQLTSQALDLALDAIHSGAEA